MDVCIDTCVDSCQDVCIDVCIPPHSPCVRRRELEADAQCCCSHTVVTRINLLLLFPHCYYSNKFAVVLVLMFEHTSSVQCLNYSSFEFAMLPHGVHTVPQVH